VASESDDLKELRRLLRAGFQIAQIVLKSGSDEEGTGIGLQITKTPTGATAHFHYPPESATREQPDGPLTVSIPDDMRFTEIALRHRSGAERTMLSSVRDVWDFAIAMRPSLDDTGDRVLRRFRDTGRQVAETKHFATYVLNAQERAEYLRRSVARFGPTVDSNLKALLIEYLRTRQWGAPRFTPLKDKFFEVQQVLLHETRNLMETQKQLCAANPQAQAYSELVDGLLNAFWQNDEGFMKRSMRFASLVRFDIADAIVRASDQRRHVDELLRMLAHRGSVPGRQGIPHLLDAYRRYCEALRPFIDVLSEMVCAVEKLPPIPPNLGYQKRVAIIKSTRFAAIVRCLDPDIRHSESHMGTVIDDDKANVLLTEIGEDGHRRTLGHYSYWQIGDMTMELQNGLFVAVLTSFALHETGLLLTAMVTPEFLSALVSIDNLAD
jgi:hypothetical protein